jgi:hypothetical protein
MIYSTKESARDDRLPTIVCNDLEKVINKHCVKAIVRTSQWDFSSIKGEPE